jgi:GGDEF domain-containing protein
MQVKSLADELQISKETLQIQNSKLEYDVYHDSLTGMKNRLFFWDDLNKINLQADKNHVPVTVMLFDLDRFKEVNDTYGHDAGDLLLNQVSRLTSMSSATDTFYRLGGDEFAFSPADSRKPPPFRAPKKSAIISASPIRLITS